jgi:hypothetical protein
MVDRDGLVKVVCLALVVGGALAGAGCMVAVAPTPIAVGPGVGCDLAARPWQQTSPGPCGSSVWRFSRLPDGSFGATETGCANATGTARYDGATVVMNFQYGGGAGVYTWPLDASCASAPGSVTWTSGPLTGQMVASTLAPAP